MESNTPATLYTVRKETPDEKIYFSYLAGFLIITSNRFTLNQIRLVVYNFNKMLIKTDDLLL